jgi:hypothetical protein
VLCAIVIAFAFGVSSSFGAGPTPGVNVTVTNPPSSPVPVTGSVTINGDVSGGVQSVDQNDVLFDGFVTVTSAAFLDPSTPPIDVKGYKEVRVSVQLSSCGPCGGPYSVAVTIAGPVLFQAVQIDKFSLTNQSDVGVGEWATRTYTVPGQNMQLYIKSTTPARDTLHVIVFGRAN